MMTFWTVFLLAFFVFTYLAKMHINADLMRTHQEQMSRHEMHAAMNDAEYRLHNITQAAARAMEQEAFRQASQPGTSTPPPSQTSNDAS